MVCGIDVYHTGAKSGAQNIAGFVASLNTQLTKWHSRVCMQACRQELVDMLQMCLLSAINAYHKVIEYHCHLIIDEWSVVRLSLNVKTLNSKHFS